jgi:eukaryotic-like serine/threonine-protein kinase
MRSSLKKMNTPGTTIDGKYVVIDVLSSDGGMGTILRVHANGDPSLVFAMKYCLAIDTEPLDRFRREVRLMSEFIGNSKVVQILDSNLSYMPPYFVMPVYTAGDLRTLSPGIQTDHALQEQTMLAMTDCVEELHNAGKHHRDIKPANFLRTATGLAISDLGLGMDLFSRTGVTLSNQWGGTHGYIPPEFFQAGGFKNATPRSDIFMLGKAFYNLLSGLDPQFIDKTQIPRPIFYLVERCCQQDSADRYQSTPELKQAIVSAFDVLLGRLAPLGEAQRKYDGVVALLGQGQFRTEDIKSFVSLASHISPEELFSIVSSADKAFYYILSQDQLKPELRTYLDLYHQAVLSETYLSFSYAEHVADRMEMVFKTSSDPDLRARALELAIIHAERMNRYSAMSTCSNMITRVLPDDPGESAIIATIQKTNADFVKEIEVVSCKNRVIADAITKLKGS